jgi:hypothetical protein
MASKIIVSHDVDHISSWEHLFDMGLAKFLARSTIEISYGHISFHEYYNRLKETLLGRWEFILETARFDCQNSIKSNYFFGSANGMGLSYRLEDAVGLINSVAALGHDIGIHGIARDSLSDILLEKERFEKLTGLPCKGIRLHYLSSTDAVLNLFEKAGFVYDSSLRGCAGSRKINSLIHFPIHIMDSDVFCPGKRYQSVSYADALISTKQAISSLVEYDVDYISLLFHDRYFSPAHQAYHDWYQDIIFWILDQGLKTCSYEEAVTEIRLKNL